MSADDSAAAEPTTRSAVATWLQRRGPWVGLLVLTIVLGVWGFLLLPVRWAPEPWDASGLRLCPESDAAWPAPWPPSAAQELLAEMEHGR